MSAEEVQKLMHDKKGNSLGGLLDYAEALYFGDSVYCRLLGYYQSLERIIALEWFIYKLQLRQRDVVYLDTAIEAGLPFWQEDDFD